MRRLAKQKFSLIDPTNIDQRSTAWKRWRQIVKGVASDLGGAGRLTEIERVLVDSFASASVRMYDLSARQMLGAEKIEYAELASAINNIAKIAKYLGVSRRPREVQPLSSYLNGGDQTIDAEVIPDE